MSLRCPHCGVVSPLDAFGTYDLFRFSVRGRGPFPVDGLFRDRCFPLDFESARLLLGFGIRGLREIHLRGLDLPNPQWWERRHWRVVSVHGPDLTKGVPDVVP